jgi:ferric-dicitrate binding protein FerR (iron transport regulator)
MINDDIQSVIDKYLDDRSSLDEDEMGRLINALQVDRKLAAKVKEQLLIDEMLRQRLAADGRHFPAQVDQRIRDQRTGGEAFLRETMVLQQSAERANAERELVEPAAHADQRPRSFVAKKITRRRRRAKRFWLSAAAVVLAVTASLAYLGWNARQNRAIVSATIGDVTLVRGETRQLVSADTEVQDGDRFETSAHGSLIFRYGDGTTVELRNNAAVEFLGGWGKEISVLQGNIVAAVAPQQFTRGMMFRTPTADATVLGTKLELAVRQKTTRLDVSEGSVRLTRLADSQSVQVDADEYGLATADNFYVKQLDWPADRSGLVFYTTADADSKMALAAPRGTRLFYRLVAEGNARINAAATMILDGGRIRPEFATEANRDLLEACRRSGELTVECALQTESLRQHGPARIVTFSTDSGNYNFTLGHEDDRLTLRLQTADGNGNKQLSEVGLCHLPDTQRHHVVLTYRDGLTVCYLDGEKVYENNSIRGDFSTWTPQHLLLGNEWTGDRAWTGVIRGVAIYSRFLTEDEVRRSAAANRRK